MTGDAHRPDQTDATPASGSAQVGATRWFLGGIGVLVGVYGAYLLLSRQDLDQLVSAAIWAAGGVLVHDGLIALASLVAVAVGGRLLPRAARAPAAVAMVVLGSVTLVAVPVLGRFGARSDNPTLLDRDYWLGWSAIVVLVLAAAVVASVLRARRTAVSDPDPPADPS
jgi:hypothetical protein